MKLRSARRSALILAASIAMTTVTVATVTGTAHAEPTAATGFGIPNNNTRSLPDKGSWGLLFTDFAIPTRICFANVGDQAGEGRLDDDTATPSSSAVLDLAPNEKKCVTRFFLGRTVKVTNTGDTPLVATSSEF